MTKRPASTSDRIVAALQSRYPCAEIPFGAMAALAAEFGCSRELVRQCAKRLDYSSVSVKQPKPRCPLCDAEYAGTRDVCPACAWIVIPCVQCGKPVRRRAAKLAAAMGTTTGLDCRGKPITHQGRVFCTRQCSGRWSGLHRGWGSDAHPNKQRTACARGHPYTTVNSYVSARGKRPCRVCAREAHQRQRAKR